jgi:aspartyl-tRNA synthetase
LRLLGRKIKIPRLPLKRISYTQAVDLLREVGEDIGWGEDFSKMQEAKLGELVGDAFFVKDWPSDLKAFYAMPLETDPKLCRAFDLVHNGLEISSGTQRIHLPELLTRRIVEKGLNPDDFKYYVDCFRFGAPPHAGWSIGLERITMTITGRKNIRECCLYPRDRTRLTP